MTDHPMADEKIEPLTPEEIEEWRRIAYGPPGFHAAIASAATVQRLLATIDAERKARQKAEERAATLVPACPDFSPR